MPYVGFLYAGLMISADGQPKVIEFNCRFGDPEAQPVMMRLQSDLLLACQAAVAGTLADTELVFDQRVALGVVMAAGGYPGQYDKGDVIKGLDQDLPDTKVFHAGTRIVSFDAGTRIVKDKGAATEGDVLTDGGRVLCVVGLGDDVAEAQARAYQRVDQIDWRGRYFRKDIGYRSIDRESGSS